MIFAKRALIDGRWSENVRLTIAEGQITVLETGAAALAGDTLVDTLLPALANLHSHSFQRAMAGMTEHRAAGRDSFWTWREMMYRFLGRLTPEMVEAIAALVFVEMLEAGYASVGEFHYLHHQSGGTPYDRPAELSLRIMEAASATGIGLTHLPVLYSYGGAGKAPLAGGQLRFANTLESYLELIEDVRLGAKAAPHDTIVGIAPHSLRATTPEDLTALLAIVGDGPIHMHIAEQPKEVDDITTWLGTRPVAWVLDNLPLDHRWCMIHATHMNDAETAGLARSGAVVGLCPITEANLGDGPFNGRSWLAAGGAFGIGSDSNVRISLSEELRTLEYSQRLRHLERNVMVADVGSVGLHLYQGAAHGGAQALRRNCGAIAVGKLADLVAIDSTHPALCALDADQIVDGFIFAGSDTIITDVWSAGRHQVRGGRHIAREAVHRRWREVAHSLFTAR